MSSELVAAVPALRKPAAAAIVPLRVRRAVALTLALAAAAPAFTQDAAAPADDAVLAEVQVTGTRIRRSDFIAPTPTASIGALDLERLGIVNVADAIVQIPANVSNFSPQTTGGGNFFVGSTITNLRGLNPYFGTRTLTLVDGRRFVPTSQGGGVDMNFIPSVLIDRLEVVTGGASAAYGSEAVAGVVNVLLDKRLTGVKAEVDYGQSFHGDGGNFHAGLAAGTALQDGRGHFVIGGEMQRQTAITNCVTARDWCADSYGLVNLQSAAPGAALGVAAAERGANPQWLVSRDVRLAQLGYTGVFQTTPTNPLRALYPTGQTLQSNAAGTALVPYNLGQYSAAFNNQAIGGDGRSVYDRVGLIPEIERQTAYAHYEFKLTDRTTLFAEASFGNVSGLNIQNAQNDVGTLIRPDNAFLGTATLAGVANGVPTYAVARNPLGTQYDALLAQARAVTPAAQGLVLRKDWSNQVNTFNDTDTKVWRTAFGGTGSLFDTGWTWDAYFQFGRTERQQYVNDNRHLNRYALALDSIVNPATGQPACRSSVTGIGPNGLPLSPLLAELAVGCTPVNPFGSTTLTETGRDYTFGFLRENLTYEQYVSEVSASGDVFRGIGAGAFTGAAGLQYRYERGSNLAALEVPRAERTDYLAQFGDSFAGKVAVWEAFAELDTPLLRDLPGAELLSFNSAFRHARYKNTGLLGTTGQSANIDMNSWKVSSIWEPVNWLRVRASQSRDVRAAGFRELYYAQTLQAGGTFGFVTNPWLGQTVAQDEATINLRGNEALQPEKADTTTIGIVVTPTFVDRLSLSADYYRIKIKGGITPAGTNTEIAQCYAGSSASCGRIQGVFDPALVAPNGTVGGFRDIAVVNAVAFNGRGYETKGIDFSADYSLPLADFSENLPGTIGIRLIASHTIETLLTPNSLRPDLVRDIAGVTGPTSTFLADWTGSPDWTANLIVSYANGPLALTAQGRYVDSGRLDPALAGPGQSVGGPNQPATAVSAQAGGYNPALSDSVNDGTIASAFFLNLTASYDFSWGNLEKLTGYLTVNNVLDRAPAVAPTGVGGTNAVYFDTLGANWRLGVRMKF